MALTCHEVAEMNSHVCIFVATCVYHTLVVFLSRHNVKSRFEMKAGINASSLCEVIVNIYGERHSLIRANGASGGIAYCVTGLFSSAAV